MSTNSSRRLSRLTVAVMVTLLAAAAFASPAAAYSSQESGLVGPYSYSGDTEGDPLGTCGYHDPGYSNWIWLDWVRVKAPTVYAADRNSSKRESRTVTFQLKIEKHMFGSPDPWKVVASSPIQHATAYDNQAAALSPIKFFFTPNKTNANGQGGQYRALILIKWLKKDGSTEGSVKIWPSWYKINSPYAIRTHTDYCPAIDTNG